MFSSKERLLSKICISSLVRSFMKQGIGNQARISLLLLFTVIFFINTSPAQSERDRRIKIQVGATADEASKNTDVQLWAVVIGVSRYKFGDQTTKDGEIPNLKNAGDDAQAMYDFLRSP